MIQFLDALKVMLSISLVCFLLSLAIGYHPIDCSAACVYNRNNFAESELSATCKLLQTMLHAPFNISSQSLPQYVIMENFV